MRPGFTMLHMHKSVITIPLLLSMLSSIKRSEITPRQSTPYATQFLTAAALLLPAFPAVGVIPAAGRGSLASGGLIVCTPLLIVLGRTAAGGCFLLSCSGLLVIASAPGFLILPILGRAGTLGLAAAAPCGIIFPAGLTAALGRIFLAAPLGGIFLPIDRLAPPLGGILLPVGRLAPPLGRVFFPVGRLTAPLGRAVIASGLSAAGVPGPALGLALGRSAPPFVCSVHSFDLHGVRAPLYL